MYNIVFVILHYETLEDTRKCINSLMKYLSNERVQIIVVDNGSKKGKLKQLKPLFMDMNQIYFLYSNENLGFARGNNIGYVFAKNTLNADIIVLANNDLLFNQEDFVRCLIKKYEITKFDIAGPKIISMLDGKNQNPIAVQYHGIKDIYKRLFKYYILLILSVLKLDTVLQKKFAKRNTEFIPSEDSDYQLHGSCIFFGKKYLKKYDGLFDKTFMYGEENIIKYFANLDNMKMLYFDDVIVLHKEGSSTSAVYGKNCRKRQFYYRWNINSCKLLIELMKKT